MDDARDFVSARQIDRVEGICDIQRFDENSLAEFGFNEVRLAQHAIARKYNFLTGIDQSLGRVQSNES